MTAKTQDSNRVTVSAPPPQQQTQRPLITLPPRPSAEALFSGGSGASPGPMTLVSSFFGTYPESDFRSFSQLLAGAMGSPVGSTRGMSFFSENPADGLGKSGGGSENGGEGSSGFKQSRPMSLAVARPPLFTVPPGLSPSGLLNSPGFYSPQSPFGMSHQQALAQVTAQAALAQSRAYMQPDYQPSSVAAPTEPQACQPYLMPEEASRQQTLPSTSDTKSSVRQSSEASHSDGKYQPSSTGRPADDSYNWRKYGQKLVKGSEFPQSYYKCTHMNCPVKKRVERSPNGEITEIIYKGQHNHEVPQPSKRPKDGDLNGPKPENGLQRMVGDSNRLSENVASHSQPERDQESTEAYSRQLPGGSDNEELGDGETREEGDADEPNAKRRNIDVGASEVALPHQTVTEPKIIVQTRSEVDLLDDGYRWRKYGQKVVKGNPYPRSYYKCTFAGCTVRKHVERASTDAKAVIITTYEGKHNHDVLKANSEDWIFLVTSLCMEILSAACDQASSPSRPRYALFGMLLAIAALLTCIPQLIYKGRKRGCDMLFGSEIELFGLVGGIAQCVCSIIQYVYYIRHAENPIKLSLLPAIFLICLIAARLSRKRMQTRDETGERTA